MRLPLIATLGLSFWLASPLAPAARAESWCAYPLWVHEWGVHVFGADGAPATGPALPDHFHTPARPGARAADARGPAVRTLPVDSGVRALPVLHFYARAGTGSPIPLGLEVGFSAGDASAWFPEVDLLRAAADANGPAAIAARLQLIALRQARPSMVRAPVPSDPTRQLVWNRLDLTPEPTRAPPAIPAGSPATALTGQAGPSRSTQTAWVAATRKYPSLWVNGPRESERFVFYEATTHEKPLIRVQRASDWSPTRRHLALHNDGSDPVHDVFFTHREDARTFVFYAPSIPAGQSAGFLLDDHAVTARDLATATIDKLRNALVDPAAAAPPKDYQWDMNHCVMGRDPAIPFERAEGHRLYGHEIDTVLSVWGARFFAQAGTTILYREDTALLDRVMPLSLYTDMYNYVVLRRLGLALWEHVAW
jgi:hypothetical protein